MVIDMEWAENVRREVSQQMRDIEMQSRGAMLVIDALVKKLNEPDQPTDEEGAQPAMGDSL